MHRPPPIRFAVSRSRWLGRALVGLLLLDMFSSVLFFFYQPSSVESISIFLVISLLAVGISMHVWSNAPVGHLRWDGKVWYWSGFGSDEPCSVRLQMDFQSVLVVSIFQEGGGNIWVWIDALPGSPDWLALRRAFVNSQRTLGATSPSDHALVDVEGR